MPNELTGADKDPAVIICPVTIAGDITGILVVTRESLSGKWNKEDILFSRSVANIISLALTIDQLEQAKSDANAASQAKSNFLANVSHELKTPLNAIIGFSDLIQMNSAQDVSKEDIVEFTKIIKESGQHLLTIINDILDITSTNQDSLTVTNEPINILQSTKKVCEDFEPQCKEKSISVHFEGLDNTYLEADQGMFNRCLNNLFSNAVKFSGNNSNIWIGTTLRKEKGWIEIFVRDEGIGMKAPEKDAANKVFYQADDRSSRNYAGMGIGLTIVQKMAALNGGQLLLESEAGKGTTASLAFPLDRFHQRISNEEQNDTE